VQSDATASQRSVDGNTDAVMARVDPRAPRFGQSVTTLGLATGIVLNAPLVIYAVTVVLVTAVVSRWQVDLYASLWRRVVVPVVGSTTDREPASPHRFARVLGAVGTTLASVLLLAGFPLAGYVVAGAVAALAGLAATTGFCLGCRMYRQVALFRRLGLV
jgi:hypothetical protein